MAWDGIRSRRANKEERRYLDLHDLVKARRGVLKFAKRTKPKSYVQVRDSSSSSGSCDDGTSGNDGIRDSHGSSWVRDRLLGEGGFGSVFLAKNRASTDPDSELPAEIAVKTSLMENSSSLQLERKVLNDLASCINVIYCNGEEITRTKSGEEVYNLLLEYCSGSSLHDHILEFGPKGLPESEVRRYTRDIVRGLHCIHCSGYIHCDIKPENILLAPGVRIADKGSLMAKIADFGLAKKMMAEVLGHGIRGTGPYMSPELVNDNVLDWPADIWALGCVVVEMLTGKQARIATDPFELLEIPSEISSMGRDFLERCFVTSPYRRTPACLLLKHPFVAV